MATAIHVGHGSGELTPSLDCFDSFFDRDDLFPAAVTIGAVRDRAALRDDSADVRGARGARSTPNFQPPTPKVRRFEDSPLGVGGWELGIW